MRTADRTLAARYARALFAAAAELGQEKSAAEELRAGTAVFAAAGAFLGDPRVSREDKKHLVEEGLTGRASALTLDFMRLLIDEKRYDLMAQATADFAALLLRERRVARAFVRAARPLSEEAQRRLRERLESFAGCGVELEVALDPDILGGLHVRMGDWVLDSSLRGQLSGLKEALGGD